MFRVSWSMWSSKARIVCALTVSAALLNGCGFRMQGAISFPEVLATSHLATADRYTEFYRGLRSELQRGDVEVVESVVAASAVIRIEQDSTGQTVLTVSGRNVPTSSMFLPTAPSVTSAWAGPETPRSSSARPLTTPMLVRFSQSG